MTLRGPALRPSVPCRSAPLELQVGRRYRSTPVPFAPSPTWRLSPEGEIWFTDAGGRVEPGRIPAQKPALKDFFFEDNGRIWVLLFDEEKSWNPALDLFDADGRYLGEVKAPFPIQTNPAPIIRDGVFYAVSTDEFNLPYVVRARFSPDPEGLD